MMVAIVAGVVAVVIAVGTDLLWNFTGFELVVVYFIAYLTCLKAAEQIT